MKALLKFELGNYFKRIGFYVLMILLMIVGAVIGSKFLLSIGPDIYKNSAYTIAYMTGFLSLFSILFSTLLATQILFKEKDNNFNLILYATPIRKYNYLLSRFLTIMLLSFICFSFLMIGFAIGQQTVIDRSAYTQFHLYSYLQPLMLFGLLNTFFCCSMLCSVGWFTGNKLMVYVTGLFIYILYMVMLIFSGSPMMAQGLPQTEVMIRLSACLDPFGLSGFFMQTSNWSVLQRNTELIAPSGIFLLNRIGVVLVSAISLLFTFKTFSFSVHETNRKKKLAKISSVEFVNPDSPFKVVEPSNGWQNNWTTLFSFIKLDVKYITKSIPFILACIGLLFVLSMEMYGNIEKGIRIPQQYATSGLMATTIIDSFPGFCLIIMLYYGHEIFWRSRNSNFHLIENATAAGSSSLFFSKWLTLGIIIVLFTSLMILLGISFQLFYQYPQINWSAYLGVYLFVSLPLTLSAGIILMVQKLVNHRYIGLLASSIVVLFTATTIGKRWLENPLLKFQIPYSGQYSDMNGFGTYAEAYGWKILFGACVVLIGSIVVTQMKKWRLTTWAYLVITGLLIIGCIAGHKVLEGYIAKDEEMALSKQAAYERRYRRFQKIAQPTVVDITSTVDLYPEKNSYEISATYILQNKTSEPIKEVLINFSDDIQIHQAVFNSHNERVKVKDQYTVISLQQALQPGDSAQFQCIFSYKWSAVNGHVSFNAIIQNGSFIRLSRYFPAIGYLSDHEIEPESDRRKYNLGKATALTLIDAPTTTIDHFLNLEMTISTSGDQIAIGVGELMKSWTVNKRNYFQYKSTSPVPFHFAISSASYAVATAMHKGKRIEIYYHPGHFQNVAHLLRNIKLTLDYCQLNFGPYPFSTIRFAEVSGFTKGFAATAYPATIYMTENMIFNANIHADQYQDVINELAGHELAHIWWGNTQISPDRREGGPMLTETLAMYTELMLVKKMHGKKRVMENVNMHLGIYLNERGYSEEEPLYKVPYGKTHLLYSKGLVVMYQLTELIGEEKLNTALQHFLQKYAHPANAISTDFINELYAVSNPSQHPAIDDLLKKITLYNFKSNNITVSQKGNQYELALNATAEKYYEDGKGNRTKSTLSDSIDVAIYCKDAKQKIYKLAIVNNEILGKILLDKNPVAIEFDPDGRFIKIESGKQLIDKMK